MFTIDGIKWNVKCKIDRTAEMRASDISGLMLDRGYFNDVIGTYMSYTISVAVPFGMENEYSTLYELLTQPVGEHSIQVPYNQGEITINGRIQNVSDTLVKRIHGNYWMGTSFQIVSNYPTKAMSRGEMIVAGRAPLPPVSNPDVGDAYTYTESGWVPSETYDVADDIYY